MAFKLYSTDDGHVPAWEYLPVSDTKLEIGMGLAFGTSGKLISSATPAYICMAQTDNFANGEEYPVVKITPDQIWESELFAAATDAKVGAKVEVSTNGKNVDASKTTTPTFLVTYLEGTAKGDTVRGRFI